jgi:hypothetical protein
MRKDGSQSFTMKKNKEICTDNRQLSSKKQRNMYRQQTIIKHKKQTSGSIYHLLNPAAHHKSVGDGRLSYSSHTHYDHLQRTHWSGLVGWIDCDWWMNE